MALPNEQPKPTHFTQQQIEKLSTVSPPEWKLAMLFGYCTKSRNGDIAKMTWNAVDFEKDTIQIVPKETRNIRKMFPRSTTNKGQVRMTLESPILPTLVRKKQEGDSVFQKNLLGNYVFCYNYSFSQIFKTSFFNNIKGLDYLLTGSLKDQTQIKNFIEQIKLNPHKSVVGERIKRSESLFFKFCYSVHKTLTFAFTGQSIKFGNYTCLPKSTVEKMINDKSTWSSFSGALTKLEKERSTVPSIRGPRYFGPSKMSFKNLLIHSLAIISVFKINVLIRSISVSYTHLTLPTNREV